MSGVDAGSRHDGPVTYRPPTPPPPDRAARFRLVVLILGLGIALVGAARFLTDSPSPAAAEAVGPTSTSVDSPEPSTSPTMAVDPTSTPPTVETTSTTTSTTLPPRPADVVPEWTVGRAWGEVTGLTMFRGNPTRTWYGAGPAPVNPRTLWSYPESGGLCGKIGRASCRERV